MEVKVRRSRLLGCLNRRESGKVNIRSGVTTKEMVRGKWTGKSERQVGARARDSRSVWLGSNGRQPERLGIHIGRQT